MSKTMAHSARVLNHGSEVLGQMKSEQDKNGQIYRGTKELKERNRCKTTRRTRKQLRKLTWKLMTGETGQCWKEKNDQKAKTGKIS